MKKTKEAKVGSVGGIQTGELLSQMSAALGADVSRRLLYMWVSAGTVPRAKEVVAPGNTRPTLVWEPATVKAALQQLELSRDGILKQRAGLIENGKAGRALPTLGIGPKPEGGFVPRKAPEKVKAAPKAKKPEVPYDPDWKVKATRAAEEKVVAEEALESARKLSAAEAKLREESRMRREAEERLRRITESLVEEQSAHAKTAKALNGAMSQWRFEQESHAKTSAQMIATSKRLRILQSAKEAFSKEESEYLAAWLFLQVSGHSSEAKRQIHLASAPFAVLSQIKARYTLQLTFTPEGLQLSSAPNEGVTSLVHIPDRNYGKHADTDGIKDPLAARGKKPAAL